MLSRLLNGLYKVSWPQLIGLQQSFASKALLIIPIVAFAIATAGDSELQDYLVDNWKIHFLFWGALTFVAGHVVLWRRKPVEFARHRSTEDAINEIVALSNADTFASRCDLLRKTIERYQKHVPKGLENTELETARLRVAQPTCELAKQWEQNLPLVVVSQRRLIAFDRPGSRLVSVLLLGAGISLMLTPMIFNVAVTATTMLTAYARWSIAALGRIATL